MPLQIRRGTNAERLAMTQKLADGELLWVTDDKKLYVGDGATASNVLAPVTGFNAEDAQDAAASLFTTATHSGISFAYDSLAGTLTATVDINSYTGSITADAFNGSVFADDSTILVDAVEGVLKGQLIGSLTGNVTGNVTGDVSGNLTGDVTGNVTGVLTGSVVGDIKGSVFADNSSILVDAVDRIFYGTIDTGNAVLDSNSLTSTAQFFMGSTSSLLDLTLNLDNNLQVRQVADTTNGKFITMNLSRGTLTAPTAIQAGDELGGVLVRAYSDSSTSAIAGVFGFVVDPTATIAGGNFVKSQAIIAAASDTSQDVADALILDSSGVATSNGFVATKYNQLAVYANDAARSSAIPTPVQGMLVFMQSGTVPAVTNKTVVYDGSAWVALH